MTHVVRPPNQALRSLTTLPDVRLKPMFGGTGIYQSNLLIGLLNGQAFYLRAQGHLEKHLERLGCSALLYRKRGVPIRLRYYCLPKRMHQQTALLYRYLRLARRTRLQKQQLCGDELRIKALPNLNIAHERFLRRAGIHSVSELKQLGASRAFLKIRARFSTASLALFLRLSAALEGKHLALLGPSERTRCLEELRALESAQSAQGARRYHSNAA